jgi:hypothetical protein
MTDDFKLYSISSAGFLQYFTELVNPVLSFFLLVLTILYTYQKYRNIKNQNKK